MTKKHKCKVCGDEFGTGAQLGGHVTGKHRKNHEQQSKDSKLGWERIKADSVKYQQRKDQLKRIVQEYWDGVKNDPVKLEKVCERAKKSGKIGAEVAKKLLTGKKRSREDVEAMKRGYKDLKEFLVRQAKQFEEQGYRAIPVHFSPQPDIILIKPHNVKVCAVEVETRDKRWVNLNKYEESNPYDDIIWMFNVDKRGEVRRISE